ncbi:putative integral membrane protein [Oceanobacillus picturae]|uniref:Integral membrane protein n=1 Tax=Oceanobacillus picturae TaxID=171693 RepID=W9AGF3_9BACI|nr:lipopolysaccharide assembly protein LapA domain-containing protein [Oceanobacillus picturae]CDO01766.1 putative integral membrane protein [Oceanobacillus picturae]
MKGQGYVILAIIFVIIVAVFAVTNVDPVEVNYLFWTAESPLILIILFSVLMGGIITAAVGVIRMFRLQRQVRSLQKENETLHTQLRENDLEPSENIQNDTDINQVDEIK